MTQILVVKPGTLTLGDRKKLRLAGIVTVEAEAPQDVRLLGTEGPPLDGNDLLFAAVQAMLVTKNGDYCQTVKIAFADIIARIMGEQRKAQHARDD